MLHQSNCAWRDFAQKCVYSFSSEQQIDKTQSVFNNWSRVEQYEPS